MKSLFKVFAIGGVAAGMLLPIQRASAQPLVYNNSTNLYGGVFNQFVPTWAGVSHEVGDEIFLSNPNNATYQLSNFDFEYFGSGTSGNEQVRVRFYLNDGANGAPGTKFFDSGLINVSGPSWQTTKGTVVFGPSDLLWLGNPVILPNTFTWTVQLSGTTDPGEDWGLYIYTPPTLGNSYTSYWNNDPMNGWLLSVSENGMPMDFGARVWAVPEPSGLALGITGGLLILLLRTRTSRH